MRQQTRSLAAFHCLADRCPDTCCKGWGMQLSKTNVEKFERDAPALLDAVSRGGESDYVMKRDGGGACVKLAEGWCGIHRDYGASFLGDACYYFPRIPRAVGEGLLLSAALSCPEITRLVLEDADPFALVGDTDGRVPTLLRNYGPEGMEAEAVLGLHRAMLEIAGDGSVPVEHALMRLSAIARALDTQEVAQWPNALPLYTRLADGRLPAAEASVDDPFHLLEALVGLMHSAHAERPRLDSVVARMAASLGVTIDGVNVTRGPQAAMQVLRLLPRAQDVFWQPVLRRYLQAQLSENFYPFGGLGQTLTERITVIAVRFATVKLALAGLTTRDVGAIVETIQPLSRLLDHLADAALSLSMYSHAGWLREARLRALVGDPVA